MISTWMDESRSIWKLFKMASALFVAFSVTTACNTTSKNENIDRIDKSAHPTFIGENKIKSNKNTEYYVLKSNKKSIQREKLVKHQNNNKVNNDKKMGVNNIKKQIKEQKNEFTEINNKEIDDKFKEKTGVKTIKPLKNLSIEADGSVPNNKKSHSIRENKIKILKNMHSQYNNEIDKSYNHFNEAPVPCKLGNEIVMKTTEACQEILGETMN